MRVSFIIFSVLVFLFTSVNIKASEDDSSDSTKTENEEKIKEGFNFGGLPVLGYNTDIGFQYGLILNVFNYGDGTYYPEYKYSFYAEVSRSTLGNGVNQLFFDSKHLLPNQIRITSDLSYLTERTLNFYGFNGYDAVYNSEFEIDTDPEYISRVFYRHERKFLRFTLDFQGKMFSKKILWLAGLGYFSTNVATVDIDRLNKGKKESKILPDTTLLYDHYVDWGIIKEDEKDGGKTPYFKTGVVFDTRDNEPNPMKGIWSEILLFYTPKILGNHTHSYLKLAITHRQYITLVKDKLSFVYRLGYQGTLAGSVPFYMQPYMITSFSRVTSTDGLGGAKTLRGILRNRVVGDGIAYGNFEVRWKFLKTVLWKQNIYLALNAFADGGAVVNKIDFDINSNELPENPDAYFAPGTEASHWSVGGGFRIAMNQNFIIAADYGIALDKRDGKDGIYIGIGYLF